MRKTYDRIIPGSSSNGNIHDSVMKMQR